MFASRTTRAARRPSNFKPQTLLFSLRDFTKPRAVAWAKAHGYSVQKVTVEHGRVHIRQHDPDEIIPGTWATVPFGAGVTAVFGRLRPAVMRREYGNADPGDALAFNTSLAKLFQRLKKDAGAVSIAQNYRGTGSQAYRRQLWVRFRSGAVIDVWLEARSVRFGGVVKNAPPGGTYALPRGIEYGDKTPEQIYAEAAAMLRVWANPAAGDRGRRRR